MIEQIIPLVVFFAAYQTVMVLAIVAINARKPAPPELVRDGKNHWVVR